MNTIDDAVNDPSLKQLADLERRMIKGETNAGPYFSTVRKNDGIFEN